MGTVSKCMKNRQTNRQADKSIQLHLLDNIKYDSYDICKLALGIAAIIVSVAAVEVRCSRFEISCELKLIIYSACTINSF
jgi:hypothetical protein